MTEDAKQEELAVLADHDLARAFAYQLCPTPSEFPGRNGIEYMIGEITRHRHRHSQPQTDTLKKAREALEGMVRYSGMRESWQDDNPQYVTAALDAIGVINAALGQSK